MSFLRSLRRRSAPPGETSDEAATIQPHSPKYRSLTTWSPSLKKHHSRLWDLQIAESELLDDLKREVIEAEFYPAFDPINQDHLPTPTKSAEDTEEHNSKPELQDHSRMSSKSSPFSSLRGRSRSRSRSVSTSPTRNIFARAAELIKAPTSFFYKESGNGGPCGPVIADPSPSKTIRSRKSVHFLPDEEHYDIAPKSSPIPIPSKSAPSLPPLQVSSPAFIGMDTGSSAALTGRPPRTPILDAQNITVSALPSDNILSIGPPAIFPSQCLASVLVMEQQAQGHDPFDDDAAEDQSGLSAKHSYGGTGREKFVHLSASARANENNTIDHCEKGANVSFIPAPMSPTLSKSDCTLASLVCHKSPPTSLRSGNRSSNETDVEATAADNTGLTNLPLRLKSRDSIDSARDVVEVSGREGTTGQDIDTNVHVHELQMAATDAFTDIGSPYPDLTNSWKSRSHADREVTECAALLDRMKIDDDSSVSKAGVQTASAGRIGTVDNNSVSSPGRTTSTSPSRRRFRFENTTETSSSIQTEPLTSSMVDLYCKATQDFEANPAEPPVKPDVASNAESLQPSKILRIKKFRDQYNWSPFADENFVKLASGEIDRCGKTKFKECICKAGGLFEFWQRAGLPKGTGPQMNSSFPTEENVDDFIDLIVMKGSELYQKLQEDLAKAMYKSETTLSNNPEVPLSPAAYHVKNPSQSFGPSPETSIEGSDLEQEEDAGPWCPVNPCDCNLQNSKVEFLKVEAGIKTNNEEDVAHGMVSKHQADSDGTIDHKDDQSHLQGTDLRHQTEINAVEADRTPPPNTARSATMIRSGAETKRDISVPDSDIWHHLPSIERGPIRYFNGGSIGSKTTLASDTDIDEEVAFCHGIV